MAISTKTIQDSINWAKRMSFNRNPVIGNSLEPALTSANIVMQTILGPPFSWWWNNKELVFTCSPTLATAAITTVALTSNVLTVTLSGNNFAVGNLIRFSGLTTATWLNGKVITVDSVTVNTISSDFAHADYASAADTGLATNTSTQDYTIPAPEFSHIEHASVLDIDATTGNPVAWKELTVRENLGYDSTQSRPDFVSPHVEDGNGNMTFRVFPSPDKAYPISIHAQLAPPQLTSINATWAPLPDFMQYVYNWGFLALIWIFSDEPRAGYANEKFVSALLARAEGIDEEDRNIFLANWNNLTTAANMQAQMGTAARGK